MHFLNDHNSMNTFINMLGMFAMICGLVGLYLAVAYPTRRKR